MLLLDEREKLLRIFSVDTLGPHYNCVIYSSLSDIKLKRWRKEMVGHTVMYSSVLNLHQPKKTLPVKGEGKFVLPELL